MIYFYRALSFLFPWSACVVTDYYFHKVGFHRGPWRWKWSVASFGIGTLIVLWAMHHFDPHFLELP